MDAKKIVYKGDTAKWQITIHHADFDQQRDDYRVELRWGMFGKSMTIHKEDMFTDEEGHVFMMFDSSEIVGRVTAYCIYDVPDTDLGSGIRQEIDIQVLCVVTDSPCPHFACDCNPVHGDGQEHVTYNRVFRGDANTLFLNLRTVGQEPIMDSEGKQLRVRKHDLT